MFLTIDDTTHHLVTEGPDDGPVLVLLHSLGTNLHLWDPQVARLAARRRIVRLDMRGHGLTSQPKSSFVLEDLAADVLAVLDRISVDHFAVAGVSIGGMIAQALATGSVGRVERAILIDTSAVTAFPPMWQARAEAAARDGIAPFAEEMLARWVTPPFRDHPSAEGLKTMLLRTSVEGFMRSAEALATADFSMIRDCRVPTLVIVGEHDMSTPLVAAKSLAEARGGRVVVLPGAAHIPNFERPDDLAVAIEAFLDSERTSHMH